MCLKASSFVIFEKESVKIVSLIENISNAKVIERQCLGLRIDLQMFGKVYRHVFLCD